MMNSQSFSWKNLEIEKDLHFFNELVKASPEWSKEECVPEQLETYLSNYSMYNGVWQVWELDGDLVGICYVLEWSPSNEKPWLGTILIHPSFRGQGFAKKIIAMIGEELKARGHKALFAACPSNQSSWLLFLGKCGFEQYKFEIDDHTSQQYILTVKPL